MRSWRAGWMMASGLLVAGCIETATGAESLVSGDDFIDEGDVTNLPPGDATGDVLSGFYRLERFAVVDRACARGSVGQVFGVLEPGVDGFVFEHSGGDASMLGWSGVPLEAPVYAGGVDADGDFGLGAVDDVLTSDGNVVGQTLYRVDGEIAGELLTSTWRQRVRYSLSGDEIDCQAVVEVDARLEPGREGDPCTAAADCPSFAPNCVDGGCWDGTVGDPCAAPADCVSPLSCDGSPLVCR